MDQKKRNILIISAAALVLNLLLIYALTVQKTSLSSGPILPTGSASSSSTADKAPRKQPSPTPRPRTATFSLSPAKTTVSANESFTLGLTLATEFALAGADAVLRFDPEILTVEEIDAGQIFSLYPRLTYDNDEGRIVVTGINIDFSDSPDSTDAPDSSPFATIVFRAEQAGRARVRFEFEYGRTAGSTAVRAADAKNILSHVENATITIE